MFGIRALIAKNYIDNLTEEVDKGNKEKLRLGEYPHQAPLGYLNAKDPITKKSIIIIDDKNKHLIQTIFNVYTTGQYSLKSIVQYVEDLKLTKDLPIGRCELKKSVMSRMLHNPFYVSKFMWQDKLYEGKHTPIVELDMWQTVQDVLNSKKLNTCQATLTDVVTRI